MNESQLQGKHHSRECCNPSAVRRDGRLGFLGRRLGESVESNTEGFAIDSSSTTG